MAVRCEDGATAFETRNALHHGPEKLIIGKFCRLGTGTRFIMNSGRVIDAVQGLALAAVVIAASGVALPTNVVVRGRTAHAARVT